MFVRKLVSQIMSKVKILKNNAFCWYKDEVFMSDKAIVINIEFIDIQFAQVKIEGFVLNSEVDSFNEIQIYAQDENKKIYRAEWKSKEKDEHYYNSYTKDKLFFYITIPIKDIKKSISFSIYSIIYNITMAAQLKFNKYIKFDEKIEKSYYIINNYCISFSNGKFKISRNTFKNRICLESSVMLQLIKKKKYKNSIIRLSAFLLKETYRKEIWSFIDRLDKADDNAEALFKYSIKKNDGVKKYFFINKNTKDFLRLKKLYKNIIPYGTYKQKVIMMLSSKVISSHIDVPMRYPFAGNGSILRSLSDFKFIFLQHGIIKDNLSDWLNRYNKDINLFITSTQKEYESILNEDYSYTSDVVKLTGLPRYDYLNDKSKNQIIIMPTWRNSLVNAMKDNGEREYSEQFKQTEYYRQYNRILNDKRLINTAKNKGIRILFMPHPNMQCQIKDFNKNEYVEFVRYDVSYNKLLCESKLLITDYSSVAFDFAYMKKPIIYHQFDYNEVFNCEERKHIYKKGYFDYETMGFGPVSYNIEDTVDYIINYIENNFESEQLYIDRVNYFFKFKDNKNCERVYNQVRRN